MEVRESHLSKKRHSIRFLPNLADARKFPPAHVLASPYLSPSFFKYSKTPFNVERAFHFTANGRNAVGLAADRMKQATRNRILVPAFHCPALVEPFIWHGYEIIFYPLQADLGVDLLHLEQLMIDTAATHIVVVRFFGFSQNVDKAITLASRRSLSILEDCAHALYSVLDNDLAVSRSLHFRIFSLSKFLPTTSGGAIHPDSGFRTAKSPKHGPANEALAIARLVKSNRPPRQQRQASPPISPPNDAPPTVDADWKYFFPDRALAPGYRHNIWIYQHTDHWRVRHARRSNFQVLATELSTGCGGQPLYDVLDKSVPYVMPFLLNDERHFMTIRRSGIQILRWEQLASEVTCKVSLDYRRRLIQIPCHQSMKARDIEHIVRVFRKLEAE